MLRSELRRLKKITNVGRADQCTQTVEEESLVSAIVSSKLKQLLLLLYKSLLFIHIPIIIIYF